MLTALIHALVWGYARLLALYPALFRQSFATEMRQIFALALRDAACVGPLALLRVLLCEAVALPVGLGRAWWQVILPRVRIIGMETQENGTAPLALRGLLREFFSMALLTVIIYTVINLLVPRYEVEGQSMQPSFYDGDRLIASSIPYWLDDPQRGDVIILDRPAESEDLLKRIIGLPGETVTIQNGRVYVNDVALDEPYINAPPAYRNTWTLGPDEYFVLGDNRNRSNDSHAFGPVARDEILARVLAVYWPPQDWGLVTPPDYGRNMTMPQ